MSKRPNGREWSENGKGKGTSRHERKRAEELKLKIWQKDSWKIWLQNQGFIYIYKEKIT